MDELDVLLERTVRRVVGRDGVDDAVVQGADDGLAIGFGAQRRIHLGVRVVGLAFFRTDRGRRARDRFIGQREVVRRRLGGHADAAAFRFTDRADAAGGADVRHVQPRAGQLGEEDVALDHRDFRSRGRAGQT